MELYVYGLYVFKQRSFNTYISKGKMQEKGSYELPLQIRYRKLITFIVYFVQCADYMQFVQGKIDVQANLKNGINSEFYL